MNSIGFKNLRSLRETPDLALKPITIFVGANSSGKSTFLRALPLLRQSLTTRKASPLLWYGRFVDFGSFREAVFRNDAHVPIQLRFSFPFEGTSDSEFYYEEDEFTPVVSNSMELTVSVDISGTDKEFRDYTSQITVKTPSDTIAVSISSEGAITRLACNDINVTSKFPSLVAISRGTIIPNIGRMVERSVTRADGQTETSKSWVTTGAALDGMVALLRPFFSGRTKEVTVRNFAQKLSYASPSELIAQMERQVGGQQVLQKRLKRLANNPSLVEDLRQHLMVNTLSNWLESAESHVRSFAESISYIAPVRASTERYYRAQDLAVDEVDPQGENIPMLLQSLSVSDRDFLSSWLNTHFNFSVVADYASGHISLRYKDPEQDRYYNLADMGFGFSQVLPILVQIWAHGHLRARRTRRERIRKRLFAIEQPELHLHPKLQAKLADLLCAVVKGMRTEQREVRFVVETHSEAMVNRFGALVRKKELAEADISVVIFEKDPQTQETALRIASYDENGLLQNWPFGFFSADSE